MSDLPQGDPPPKRWTVPMLAEARHSGRKLVMIAGANELPALTRQHLAGYKTPRRLVTVPEIIRSPSGKPDYPWAVRTAETARG